MNYNEFAEKIKAKYPDYAEMDNRKLAETVIQKYPIYKNQVTFDVAVSPNQNQMQSPEAIQYQNNNTELAQNTAQAKEQLVPQNGVLTGGISQNVRTYWDKNGRIHYANEDEIPKMNWFQLQGRKIKSAAINLSNWINNTNTSSDDYKQKANLILAAETLPLGLGKTITQAGANLLRPYLGKAISKGITEGIGSGLVGGGVEGVGRGFIEGENPIKTGVNDALIGATVGGLGSAAILGGVKMYRGNKLKNHKPLSDMTQEELNILKNNAQSYYNDYIKGSNTHISEIKDILDKRKDWGIAFRSASGDPERAINTLLKNKKGFVPAAFYKEGIGDVELVWGKGGADGYGLAHIIDQRKKYGVDLNQFFKSLPETIKNGIVTKDPKFPTKRYIENPKNKIAIALDWNEKDRRWVVTAFTQNKSASKRLAASVPELSKPRVSGRSSFTTELIADINSITDNTNNFKSDFGVANIDTETNQKITEQIEKNIIAQKELFQEYRLVHADTVKKYGSIERLKAQAMADLEQHTKFGIKSEAIDDYRNLIAYEQLLQEANYVNNNIKSSVTREVLNKSPKIKKSEVLSSNMQAQNEGLPPTNRNQHPVSEINPNNIRTDTAKNVNPAGRYIGADVPENINVSNNIEKANSRLPYSANLPEDVSKMATSPDYAAEYQILHNKDLMTQSKSMVDKNPNLIHSDLLTRAGEEKENFEALDFENARQLVTKLLNEGRTEEALDLIESVATKGSKAGQAVQSMSLWSLQTPEGAILQGQKIIDKYNRNIKNPSKKIPKLSEEQAKNLADLANDVLKQTDDRLRDVATAKLLKYQAELVPVSGWQKVKTLRNISLLLNPKTLVRNIVGNGLFAGVESGSKSLASGIDNILSNFTRKRTRVMPQFKEAIDGAIRGTKEGFEDAMLGIDTRAGIGGRFDLPTQRSFKDPILGGLETALDIGLRVPDRTFFQGVMDESIANQLKAQGLKEATPEIIEQARQEALESVFQNDSAISKGILGARKALNNLAISKEFGLGDLIIPFAQTPANIIQQGINYSPFGAIKAGINFAKGNQRQGTLDLARSLVGSGIMAGGFAGAHTNNLNGDIVDYK